VSKLPALLERIKGSHVLLAGDTEGLAQRGIVINFYIEKSKVRFEINVDTATRMGLKISSKLLRLAKIVSDQDKA
jgi:phage-related holin